MQRLAPLWSLLLAVLACQAPSPTAGPTAGPAATEPVALRVRYELTVSDLPADARRAVLWVPLPARARRVDGLRVTGLSGNRSFALEPEDLTRESFDVRTGDVHLACEPGPAGSGRLLRVETAGRPLELTVRFAASGSDVVDPRDVLSEPGRAWAEVDGAAWPGLVERLRTED